MVIAVPEPFIVQGDDEQVGLFEIIQSLLAIDLVGDGITQGAGHSVENGRLKQEGLNTFRLLIENFFDQVIKHKAVAAGERFDKTGGVFLALQCNSSQL